MRRARRSGWVTPTFLGSAVAGAGLSFGRDTYKLTKDNWPFMILAFVLMGGTVYGVWNMVRGHARGVLGTLFRTIIFNGVIVMFSVMCFTIIMFMLLKGNDRPPDPSTVFRYVALVQGSLAALGLLIGVIQRRRRMRAIRVAQHNDRFLASNGLRPVGGREDVIIAPDGSELKFEDLRTDAYVFKVIGRRSARAKIRIDGRGRMIEYLPA